MTLFRAAARLLLWSALLLPFVGAAHSEPFPSRPIHLIMP